MHWTPQIWLQDEGDGSQVRSLMVACWTVSKQWAVNQQIVCQPLQKVAHFSADWIQQIPSLDLKGRESVSVGLWLGSQTCHNKHNRFRTPSEWMQGKTARVPDGPLWACNSRTMGEGGVKFFRVFRPFPFSPGQIREWEAVKWHWRASKFYFIFLKVLCAEDDSW